MLRDATFSRTLARGGRSGVWGGASRRIFPTGNPGRADRAQKRVIGRRSAGPAVTRAALIVGTHSYSDAADPRQLNRHRRAARRGRYRLAVRVIVQGIAARDWCGSLEKCSGVIHARSGDQDRQTLVIWPPRRVEQTASRSRRSGRVGGPVELQGTSTTASRRRAKDRLVESHCPLQECKWRVTGHSGSASWSCRRGKSDEYHPNAEACAPWFD